jgi:hypothetical protein
MTSIEVTRADLLALRWERQGLAAPPSSLATVTDVAALDAGVQDTGQDGHAWALALRGAPTEDRATWGDDLFLAWTLRGAPHAYRRADAAAIAVATAPFSDADAAKRIFDASKPLKAAGLGIRDALAHVAAEERAIVVEPTAKGDVSGALNGVLGEPYLRFCRPCNTIHIYEQPFRLSALQAGLALEPDTSPPVLYRLDGLEPLDFSCTGDEAEDRFDVVRTVLRFAPGIPMPDLVAVVDGAAKDLKAHVPADAVTLTVADGPDDGRAVRHALAEDADRLRAGGSADTDDPSVRLLGAYDPYLQYRDRTLLLPEEAARKDLWRMIGRPGAVARDGEIIGSWRPRTRGENVGFEVTPYGPIAAADRTRIETEADRLADFRGRTLDAVTYTEA